MPGIEGNAREYLDNLIRDLTDCLARRLHRFHAAGGLIHILLMLAVISLILHFVMGPRTT